jgi:hypothetical protein
MSETVQSRVPLIEAASRPLADNAELHLAAEEFLSQLKTSDNGAEEAVSRWNALDAGTRRPVWWIALGAMLVLISGAVFFRDSAEMLRYFQWGGVAAEEFAQPPPISEERISGRLDERQKLLLFGDMNHEDKEERKAALWRSDPENPAYFAEYATAYLVEHEKLPPDFLETARRIDPDNAWFTHLAAAVAGKKCVERKEGKATMVDGVAFFHEPPTWEILDQARMDQSLALLCEARGQSKCESYSVEMLRKRQPLLPQGNLLEVLDSIGCLSQTTVFSSIQTWPVGGVIAAKSWTLGEAGDAAGFRELSKDTEAFLRGTLGMEAGILLDDVVFFSVARSIARSFAPAAEKLGFREEAERWAKISAELEKRSKARVSRKFMVDGKPVEPRTITGTLCGNVESVFRMAENPPPLTATDLKPGRLIDHEILSRFFGYALWLVLAISLGFAALYRFRVSAMVRRLAGRMAQLIRPVDWAWILGAGVVLPFVFVMAINRLTPLGGRDFGMLGTSLLLPAGHFLGLLLVWLILPAVIIRWRLAVRVGFFGFPPPSWMSGLAVASAVIFVPWIGWVGISGSPGGFWQNWVGELGFEMEQGGPPHPRLWWAIGLLAVPLLWLVASAWRTLVPRPARLLHRAATSLLLMKAHAVAMLVILLATLGFKASEQYWFERETLLRTDASTPGWTRYEYLEAVQMRKELRELLWHVP